MGIPDTSDVKSNDFPPIRPDWYNLVFIEYEDKTDKNGNEYTSVVFNFADSEQKAWISFNNNPDFLWKVKQFKDAIGMKDHETDLTPYINTRLKAFIKNRESDGSNFPDIQKFKPFSPGEPPAAYQKEDTTPPPAEDDDPPF